MCNSFFYGSIVRTFAILLPDPNPDKLEPKRFEIFCRIWSQIYLQACYIQESSLVVSKKWLYCLNKELANWFNDEEHSRGKDKKVSIQTQCANHDRFG